MRYLYQLVTLFFLIFALSSCGAGGGSDARSGKLPELSTTCIWDQSTWDNGCTWGS